MWLFFHLGNGYLGVFTLWKSSSCILILAHFPECKLYFSLKLIIWFAPSILILVYFMLLWTEFCLSWISWVEALTPSEMVFGGNQDWMKSWRWCRDGISVLIKEEKTSLPSFLPRRTWRRGHVSTQEMAPPSSREKRRQNETHLARTLLLNFQPPELWEINLFKPPRQTMVFCYAVASTTTPSTTWFSDNPFWARPWAGHWRTSVHPVDRRRELTHQCVKIQSMWNWRGAWKLVPQSTVTRLLLQRTVKCSPVFSIWSSEPLNFQKPEHAAFHNLEEQPKLEQQKPSTLKGNKGWCCVS